MNNFNHESPITIADTDGGESDAAPLTVTIPDIHRRIGISRSETYRLLAAGKLRAVKCGTRTLVIWASVLAYIASLPPASFRAGGETPR